MSEVRCKLLHYLIFQFVSLVLFLSSERAVLVNDNLGLSHA